MIVASAVHVGREMSRTHPDWTTREVSGEVEETVGEEVEKLDDIDERTPRDE